MQEWKGSAIEKALVSIHPERFKDVNQVALSTLFIIGNEVYGSRRNLGSLTLGVEMDKASGNLRYTSDEKGNHANTTIAGIIKRLGPIPSGFAEMPEPAPRQATRLQKYACTVCGKPFRAAGEMGKVLHADDGGQFVLTVKQNLEVPAPPPMTLAPDTPSENRRNLAKVIKSGAGRVVRNSVEEAPHGRNFGTTEQVAV